MLGIIRKTICIPGYRYVSATKHHIQHDKPEPQPHSTDNNKTTFQSDNNSLDKTKQKKDDLKLKTAVDKMNDNYD